MQKQNYQSKATPMNSDRLGAILPELTSQLINRTDNPIDNLMSRVWNKMGIPSMLKKAGFKKRSGPDADEVVYLLLMWTWLKARSIAMFSRESLQSFATMKCDALYDFMKREDLSWSKFQLQASKVLIKTTDNSPLRAFVVDDTVKTRRGKRMSSVSYHFDHTTGRCVMGQQVLTLGLATEQQFVPLDNEIFISKTKAQPLATPFKDARSIMSKRYEASKSLSKPEMIRGMLSRAQRAGIQADYFLADAWFGTKFIIKLVIEKSLIGILRMKKNKLKYAVTLEDGRVHTLSAGEIFKSCIKGQWNKVTGRPYQSKSITVRMNLALNNQESDQWIDVKLLFVRGVNEEKQQAGKHDWALFLTTDTQLSDEKMLEIYALRWGIEVYFKEAKQNLGFLKEQSTNYCTYVASIHLTALRFCLLLYARHQEKTNSFSDARNQMIQSLMSLDYASRLWGAFRALIAGALDNFLEEFGEENIAKIKNQIDKTVKQFFQEVMQMDSFTLRLEGRPGGD